MNVLRKNANFVKCCHRLLTVVSSKMWMLSCILMHVATDVTATLYDARYLHHYTPTCTLRSTNQYFLDVSRFSTEFGKDRLVAWLLQSGMDCLLISDFHPLLTPSNVV